MQVRWLQPFAPDLDGGEVLVRQDETHGSRLALGPYTVAPQGLPYEITITLNVRAARRPDRRRALSRRGAARRPTAAPRRRLPREAPGREHRGVARQVTLSADPLSPAGQMSRKRPGSAATCRDEEDFVADLCESSFSCFMLVPVDEAGSPRKVPEDSHG